MNHSGVGPLGHPKIFINLVCLIDIIPLYSSCLLVVQDKPGPHPCGYVHTAMFRSLELIPNWFWPGIQILVSPRWHRCFPHVLNIVQWHTLRTGTPPWSRALIPLFLYLMHVFIPQSSLSRGGMCLDAADHRPSYIKKLKLSPLRHPLMIFLPP